MMHAWRGRTLAQCIAYPLLALCIGCAGIGTKMDVKVLVPPDPVSQKAVVIAKVEDVRSFEQGSRQAATPSLKSGKITDTNITSRAIARTRSGFGGATDNIVLPEGRTVQLVAREAVISAFREKGYSVIDRDAPGNERAIPIEITIEKFWAWVTPGIGIRPAAVEFEAELVLSGDITPLRGGKRFRGSALLNSIGSGNPRTFRATIDKGLQDLVQTLKESLD